MTEEEWRASKNPHAMMRLLRHVGRAEARLFRLFACACCARDWHLMGHVSRSAVAMAEMYADAEVSFDLLISAGSEASKAAMAAHSAFLSLPERNALWAARAICGQDPVHSAIDVLFYLRQGPSPDTDNQVAILRDIAGNPFRPVSADPAWLTSTAVALARQMYATRNFSAMPILADALQDAGCDDADVLTHCRGPGPHVRGCWVVDRVLCKE